MRAFIKAFLLPRFIQISLLKEGRTLLESDSHTLIYLYFKSDHETV